VKKQVNIFYKLSENHLKNLSLKYNTMPRMRFAETSSTVKEESNNSNPDAMEADIKFGDDSKNFLFDSSSKDKQIKRIEGLSNGLVLSNGKRTINSETSDYSDLYYDLFDN
jgi:hypothetical protein